MSYQTRAHIRNSSNRLFRPRMKLLFLLSPLDQVLRATDWARTAPSATAAAPSLTLRWAPSVHLKPAAVLKNMQKSSLTASWLTAVERKGDVAVAADWDFQTSDRAKHTNTPCCLLPGTTVYKADKHSCRVALVACTWSTAVKSRELSLFLLKSPSASSHSEAQFYF